MSVTVYVGNIKYESKEEEVKKVFDGLKIKEFKFLTTPIGMSKGFCFVEFETKEEAEKAIQQANGQEVNGMKLKVEIAREKKERSSPKSVPRHNGPRRGYVRRYGRRHPIYGRRNNRRYGRKPAQKEQKPKEPSTTGIFVKNLPYATTSEQLKELFASYEVETAEVIMKKNGKSRGFGFVTVKTEAAQKKALAEMKEHEVEGRKITVAASYIREEKKTEEAK